MMKAEQRQIAQGAARSQLRRLQIDVQSASADDALTVLDDLYRSEPDLIASIWYAQASEHQIKLFCQEWKKQFLPQVSQISTTQVQRPLTLWER